MSRGCAEPSSPPGQRATGPALRGLGIWCLGCPRCRAHPWQELPARSVVPQLCVRSRGLPQIAHGSTAQRLCSPLSRFH